MTLREKARSLVGQMTPAEKAALCVGGDFWHSPGCARLGLEPIVMTDGPHGLRKQAGKADHLGINDSVPATSFPTASATACSFDRELLRRMGTALGEKCVREDVGVILGPGVNMKRSPLCGRNFEYFSEDPYLAGEMGAALVNGIQSAGVGASVKHFAANNQEENRMTVDSVVDERALREIYLPAFEAVVKKAQPWTVMCSYNRLNGTYASQSKTLLTDILREEWGYCGMVVSDWGAVSNRAAGIAAGMDLEMPGCGGDSVSVILDAVKAGRLSEKALDTAAERVAELLLKAAEPKAAPTHTDEDDNALAREVAAQSAVLLKNEGILPLKGTESVVFIGRMAKAPRYQGAGSSRIHPTHLDSAFAAAEAAGYNVSYAPGYPEDSRAQDDALIAEAVAAAKAAEVAVIFAGLPDEYESEGFDRTDMEMPASHNRLIAAVCAANLKTVVVLQGGSPMLLPWKHKAAGILLMYLAGQAGGAATVDLLWGRECPCGKLAETWPEALADAPATANFPGEEKAVQYRESIFIGYRYYDAAGCVPAYPFGFGLSYTNFAYSNFAVTPCGENTFRVSLDVQNTGACAGREIVQLYVGHAGESAVLRAPQELRDFAKVLLQPGESKTVTFMLDARSFSYYNTAEKAWCIEGGEYAVLAGASSRDIRARAAVTLAGDGKEKPLAALKAALPSYQKPSIPFAPPETEFLRLLGHTPTPGTRQKGEPFTIDSTLGDIRYTAIGKSIWKQSQQNLESDTYKNDPSMRRMAEAMMQSMPLRSMRMMGNMGWKQVEGMADMANGHWLRGIFKLKSK